MKKALALLFFFCSLALFAQNKKAKLELKKADKLKAGTHNGQKVNKVIGHVMFKHKKTLMYCDSAYQYVGKNTIEAFSNVKIVDQSATIYGDYVEYNDDTKKAAFRDNIRIVNKDMTLQCSFLDYNLANKVAFYYNGGEINETTGARLESKKGQYYVKTDKFIFSDSVIVTKGSDRIESDSLHYNKKTQVVYFFGPSYIYSADKTLFAEKGQYNTSTESGIFQTNAWIDSKDFKIAGDSLYFDNEKQYSYAKYNVKIESKKDSATIYGQEAFRKGTTGLAKVYGNPYLVKQLMQDTMFLAADTLIAVEDTINQASYIQAYTQVRIFSKEFQGRCDSLYFSESDSLMYMYHDPIIWNNKNQITSDTILARFSATGIDRIYANRNAFIISHDTLDYYNQIKGRHLTAIFDQENNINFVEVDGNGQTLYFAHEEQPDGRALIGMNKIDCSNMLVIFKENEIQNITFYQNPSANFTPKQRIEKPDMRLKRFRWREEERPNRANFLK